MKRETGAWLAVALLSISALGVSATTLESTMSTDANDVIDLEYDQVPIGQDTASNVLDEIEGRDRNGEPASVSKTKPGEDSDTSSTRPEESAREPQQQQSQSNSQREQSQSQSQQEDGQTDGGLEMPSLLDRLLALLTALLPYLLALVAVVCGIGLAVRYRERLLAVFEDPDADVADESALDGSEDPIEGSPAHTVERAWLGMVQHLDLDRPGTMTTSECASAAIEAGLDREAVRRLTETYEEVRYGGRPVTEQREEEARQSQRRLDVGGGV